MLKSNCFKHLHLYIAENNYAFYYLRSTPVLKLRTCFFNIANSQVIKNLHLLYIYDMSLEEDAVKGNNSSTKGSGKVAAKKSMYFS